MLDQRRCKNDEWEDKHCDHQTGTEVLHAVWSTILMTWGTQRMNVEFIAADTWTELMFRSHNSCFDTRSTVVLWVATGAAEA